MTLVRSRASLCCPARALAGIADLSGRASIAIVTGDGIVAPVNRAQRRITNLANIGWGFVARFVTNRSDAAIAWNRRCTACGAATRRGTARRASTGRGTARGGTTGRLHTAGCSATRCDADIRATRRDADIRTPRCGATRRDTDISAASCDARCLRATGCCTAHRRAARCHTDISAARCGATRCAPAGCGANIRTARCSAALTRATEGDAARIGAAHSGSSACQRASAASCCVDTSRAGTHARAPADIGAAKAIAGRCRLSTIAG